MPQYHMGCFHEMHTDSGSTLIWQTVFLCLVDDLSFFVGLKDSFASDDSNEELMRTKTFCKIT